jgi:hypothetical protein
MTPLFTYNGKLLSDDNKLAINEACCCSCENGLCEFTIRDGNRGDCGKNNDPLNPRCCCECILDCSCIKEIPPPPVDGRDIVYKGKCYDCCSGLGPFYFYAQDEQNLGFGDPAGWVNNVAAYLRNNGYAQVTTHSESCDRGTGEDTLYWVRACCSGQLFCPEDENCTGVFDLAPNGNTGGFLAQSLENNCGELGVGCIQICGGNPLP